MECRHSQFSRNWRQRTCGGRGLRLVKAVHVIGDSPNFTNGELGHFKAALSNAEFVVTHATFENDVTELADVVLPSQTFAERTGTYTNLERRVQLLRPALGPKGDEEADWRIISQIASRMDADGFSYNDESEIFDELNNLISIYGGITYGRIQAGGIHWPCLATDMADVAILYQESRTESKLKLAPMSMGDVPVHEDDEYPLMLAHGRVLHQPDEDMEIIQINGRNAIQRDETIMLHPEDAAQLGIGRGRLGGGYVRSRQGSGDRRSHGPPTWPGIHYNAVRRLDNRSRTERRPGPHA